ncbi:hypothetical protein [Photobacterium leiognathi]|uniref:hypothetical protein n=1 Tax=Photobacterium leiognathi TaxID=553611 RepID=UPI002739058B|nr:hypothetical protein [Photobacterium leiognathi]
MKDLIFYGLASSLNKAAGFLIIPILAMFLSVSDYGDLSLIFIVSQLIIPIVTINICSVISRFVYSNPSAVFIFVSFLNGVLFFILSISLFLCLFFSPLNNIFIAVSIFVLSEALFTVNSTLIRFRTGAQNYFRLNFFKFLILISFLTLTYFYNKNSLNSLNFILVLFSLSNVVILSITIRLCAFSKKTLKHIKKEVVKFKSFFYFSLMLIPHILSQWIISGSDRFIVKEILGGKV